MVWFCGIMTTSHGWRLLNTLYRCEVNLVRVWRGWEVPIISYSMSPVRNHDKILRPSPHLLEWWYGMVLWHYDYQPWLKAFKHIYRYEVNLVRVWRGWEVVIISYSMSPVRNYDKILLRPSPHLLEWWYGIVLWHYDCQPWLKAFKHII